MGGIVQTSPEGGGTGSGWEVASGGSILLPFTFGVSDANGKAAPLPALAGSIPFFSFLSGQPDTSNNLQFDDTSNTLLVQGASPIIQIQATSGIPFFSLFDNGSTGVEISLGTDGGSTQGLIAQNPSSSGSVLALSTNAGAIHLSPNGQIGVTATASGRVLINTNTDDGSTQLQVNGAIKSTSLIDSGLTSGRLTFAGASGVLSDSANLTFVSGTGLTMTGINVMRAPSFGGSDGNNNPRVTIAGGFVNLIDNGGTVVAKVSTGAFGPNTNGAPDLGMANTGWKRLYFDFTNTATVGAVTINKSSGRVNVAAAATSIVVTNSLVTANSHVMAVASTNDTTGMVKNVVPAAGSFTINLVAPAAQMSIDFQVFSAD